MTRDIVSTAGRSRSALQLRLFPRVAITEPSVQATIARFGRTLGLSRLGANQEIVPPGCRTATPHAHSLEEEFVFVVEGRPDLWVDGELHPLRPGDGIAFPAGTGIAHCLINNGDSDVRLLIVGETIAGDRVAYPIDPDQRRPEDDWTDAPRRPLGPHDGRAHKSQR